MIGETAPQFASSGRDADNDLSIVTNPRAEHLMSRLMRHNFISAVTPETERGNGYVHNFER
jgi:hypothetical protein